jgi:hypothetical protein
VLIPCLLYCGGVFNYCVVFLKFVSKPDKQNDKNGFNGFGRTGKENT